MGAAILGKKKPRRGGRFRPWARGITLSLIFLCSCLGGLAIYSDFPDPRARDNFSWIQYECSNGSDLNLVGGPNTLDLTISDDDTYYTASMLNLARLSSNQSCSVRLLLPPDAWDVQSDRRTKVGNAEFAESDFQRLSTTDPAAVQISFKSHRGLRRAGWGRHSFTMRFVNGPFTIPWKPMPSSGNGGQAIPFGITIRSPEHADTLSDMTPTQIGQRSGTVATWPVASNVLAEDFSIVYDDYRTRYLADHVVDLETVVVGALLGFLLALMEPDRPDSSPAEYATTPGTAVRDRQSVQPADAHLGRGVTTLARMALVVLVINFLRHRSGDARARS